MAYFFYMPDVTQPTVSKHCDETAQNQNTSNNKLSYRRWTASYETYTGFKQQKWSSRSFKGTGNQCLK